MGIRNRDSWFVTRISYIGLLIIISLVLLPFPLDAKISDTFKEVFEARFTPAIPNQGLITAAVPPEMDKFRTFVVVKMGGVIAAERAFYFIGPGDYDYRGDVVDGSRIKTRKGKIYTRLERGTIMAVAGVVYSGRHVYLKLLSLEKIKSMYDPDLKPTRVTCMLGFKFSKEELKDDQMDKVFQTIQEWVEPFQTLQDAIKYSKEITNGIPSKEGTF